MSFLSRLFGSRSSSGASGDLEKRLHRLETEAESAAPAYVGTSYNRAGYLTFIALLFSVVAGGRLDSRLFS